MSNPGWIALAALASATAGTVLAPASLAGADLKPSVDKRPFGTTRAGQAVELYSLKNSHGLTAKVMTYGAILYSFEAPDRAGAVTNLTANRETLADYEQRSACFGALLGRYANRIARGEFTLDGQSYRLARNGGPNHIHGGAAGFDKRVWVAQAESTPQAARLRLSYTSQDGEEGYPGRLECTVSYELNDDNEWRMEYSATTDKPTVINLSNHAYWNLAGAYAGTMLEQRLTLNAVRTLAADESLIPTGEMPLVAGTPLDFRQPHRIGERIGHIAEKQFGGGYDHCFVLNQQQPGALTFCARLEDPVSGRIMEVFTTQPGVQLYSANFPSGAFEGPGGYRYPRHAGVCLETQHFPDSPNHPQFPTTVLRPGETFRSVTIHKFRVAKEG